MGGSGKSMVAKHIYHHLQIRNHFKYFVWVHISEQCQVRNVWEGILFKILSPTPMEREEIERMNNDELVRKLYQVLQRRKCLLILDDIWTVETWNRLKAAFPEDETESKILLTTRKRDVALVEDRTCFMLELRCLNEHESWELFQTYFGIDATNLENDERMKELAKEMLEQCQGLPLAIIVLARLLSRRQTVFHWEMLHKNVKEYIGKGKILGQEESTHSGVLGVLGLSYSELPYHLKQCFMHLASEPENSQIRATELCKLWMAEGLAQLRQQNGVSIKSMEDQAHECLLELVQRCMVQVVEWGSIAGRIKTCRIHGLMRELCLSKAREENFLQTINCQNRHMMMESSTGMVLGGSVLPTYKVHRLAVLLNTDAEQWRCLTKNKRYEFLRSLFCLNHIVSCGRESVLRLFFNHFRMLRVLKLENLEEIIQLPKRVDNLALLRFLSLKNSYVELLPSSIGHLKCMQTLDLRTKCPMKISNVMWKLEQLRHLYLPSKIVLSDGNYLRLDGPRSLQTLANISLDHCGLNSDLVQQASLTKLKFYVHTTFGECLIIKPINIALECLQSLAIQHLSGPPVDIVAIVSSCSPVLKLRVHGTIVKLPQATQFPPKLVKLTLDQTYLADDPMVKLEQLQNLKVLFLLKAYKGNAMVCSIGGFPRLEVLSIQMHHHLKEWTVAEGALPSLGRLHIESCHEMETIANGLRFVMTLKEIVIKRMPKKFKMKVDRGGEDFDKVQHVPFITFLETLEDI